MPLTSPFLSNPPSQYLQPLATIHPDYNPFKTSGILPAITYPLQPKPESQIQPQNKPSPSRKDKEPLYQPPDPTIGASSKPLDMNMLAINHDPPNPISSFLKTLTLDDSNPSLVLHLHHLFFPLHIVSLTTILALITHQSQIQNTCLPLMMSHLLNGMKNSLICIHGALLNSGLQITQLPKSLQSSLQD